MAKMQDTVYERNFVAEFKVFFKSQKGSVQWLYYLKSYFFSFNLFYSIEIRNRKTRFSLNSLTNENYETIDFCHRYTKKKRNVHHPQCQLKKGTSLIASYVEVRHTCTTGRGLANASNVLPGEHRTGNT